MRKNKKILILFLAILMLFTETSVFAERHARRDIALSGIIVNDHIVYSDVYPYIKNNRTYVPIRFIAEELGYDVKWDGNLRKVTMTEGNTTVELNIGSSRMLVNGKAVYLDAPAEINDDRTFVPLRAIAEAFGERVDYSEDYRAVYVGDNPKYNTFYNVVYYYEGRDPVISDYTINIATYKINVNNRITRYETIYDLTNVVYDDFYEYKISGSSKFGVSPYTPNNNYKPIKDTPTSSEVPVDKQLKDEYYVPYQAEDPFVGSWYGTTKTVNTNEYYDNYCYITKNGNNSYTVSFRAIKPNGSQLFTESYAFVNSEGNLQLKQSHSTTFYSGDFNSSWYHVAEEYIFNGVDYMYEIRDSRLNLRKY